MTEQTLTDNRPPVYMDGPVMVIRASALGSACSRALAALAVGYDRMEAPDHMQSRYDDGHLHESSILDKIEEHWGVALRRQTGGGAQISCRLSITPTLEIRGSMDADLLDDNDVPVALAEAKTMSDAQFKKWEAAPFRDFPYYATQVSIYMLAHRVPTAYYAVKNKNSGKVHHLRLDSPPVGKGEIIRRALEIQKVVRSAVVDGENVATMTCDKSMFPCPVFYLHEEVEKVQVEDFALKDMLTRYKAAQQAEAAAKAEKDAIGLEIADRLKIIGEDSLEVLGWKVTASVGSTSVVDWDTIEQLTGKKRADFTSKKPNSKATVNVSPPKDWTPGQTELL